MTRKKRERDKERGEKAGEREGRMQEREKERDFSAFYKVRIVCVRTYELIGNFIKKSTGIMNIARLGLGNM